MPRVLISESGKTPQPYRFKLDHKVVKIGRGSDNDIVIQCRSTSSEHCTMERVKGGYILRDQESTNGIKQEEALMEIIDLEDGMEVLVGDVTLEFTLSEDELEELEQEESTSHEKKKLPPISDDGEINENLTRVKPKPKRRPRKRREPRERRQPDDQRKPREYRSSTPETSNAHQSQQTIQNSETPFRPLLIFILVIIAAFTGMTLRHKMRTGEFLPSKVMHWINGSPSQQEAETPEDKTQPADEPTSPIEQRGALME